jgi:hypothetical protein
MAYCKELIERCCVRFIHLRVCVCGPVVQVLHAAAAGSALWMALLDRGM